MQVTAREQLSQPCREQRPAGALVPSCGVGSGKKGNCGLGLAFSQSSGIESSPRGRSRGNTHDACEGRLGLGETVVLSRGQFSGQRAGSRSSKGHTSRSATGQTKNHWYKPKPWQAGGASGRHARHDLNHENRRNKEVPKNGPGRPTGSHSDIGVVSDAICRSTAVSRRLRGRQQSCQTVVRTANCKKQFSAEYACSAINSKTTVINTVVNHPCSVSLTLSQENSHKNKRTDNQGMIKQNMNSCNNTAVDISLNHHKENCSIVRELSHTESFYLSVVQ